MAMGTTGMAEMAKMAMPMPPNTLPMMTGTGPFGLIEMGGMFTTVKIREDFAKDDYRDPGWYKHPPGTVASEVDAGAAGDAERQGAGKPPRMKDMDMKGMDMPGMDMKGMINRRPLRVATDPLCKKHKGETACASSFLPNSSLSPSA